MLRGLDTVVIIVFVHRRAGFLCKVVAWVRCPLTDPGNWLRPPYPALTGPLRYAPLGEIKIHLDSEQCKDIS